jgi:hypothetical protein
MEGRDAQSQEQLYFAASIVIYYVTVDFFSGVTPFIVITPFG